jgi:uncharacterized LabA/DUF88 family protein
MPDKRLVLFIDAQNTYKNARDAFFTPTAHHVRGQINPLAVGDLVVGRTMHQARLHQVRVYSGRPDSTREPRTYAAHMRQCLVWQNAGIEVITRTLLYVKNTKPQEKGIDVALALDFVTMAVDSRYEVGVVFSTDSDLRPALEYVYNKYHTSIGIEVVSWKSPRFRKRLSIDNVNIWCHFLNLSDYDSVADLSDYS